MIGVVNSEIMSLLKNGSINDRKAGDSLLGDQCLSEGNKSYGSNYVINENRSVGHYVDSVITRIGFGIFQIIAFSLAGMAYISFIGEAFTFAFISIEVTREWKINAFMFSIASAITYPTNIIGEVFAGYIADRYGRIWPYAISLVITGLLVTASAFAPTFLIFVILRGLAAIGIGGIIVLTHPTMLEFLPVKNRGNVAILTGMIQAIGLCIAGGVAWWLIPHYTRGWRYFIIYTGIVPLITAVFRLVFYIESPRFLVSQGKLERAWKVFSFMASVNGKEMNKLVTKEEFFIQVNKLKVTDVQKEPLIKKLFYIFRPPYLRRTVCLLVVYCLQVMSAYGTTLFLPYTLKVLGANPYFISFVGCLAQIPGIALMAIIVEWPKVGRRNTIRFYTALSVIFSFLFAFVQNEVATPVFTVLLYFSILPTLTAIITYITESYPTEIRVMVLAFIANITAVIGTGLPFAAGYLADQSKQHTWLSTTVWGVMFLIQFIVSLFLNHETQGRDLQDIL